ncbi:polysaccharide deacetylase family protein [Microtetraspora niveoalba]|uniref:polysaccharide deacetylase family protein n=1 Tax=Microtetraspora niveoalba TaxID=46175 RepID=UPI000A011D25|nr:polysaccharide deacetylase family protein [Microtetraspora niveoalba]
MPPLGLTGAVALLVVALASCGLPLFDGHKDRNVDVESEPTVLTFADPAKVAGLSVATISSGTAKPHVHVSYPTLADAPALNKRLKEELEAKARRFTEKTAPREGQPVPEYNVDWELTAASRDAVGVRLRESRFTGRTWVDSYRTLWYDRGGEKVVDSTSLVANIKQLSAAVRKHLPGNSPVHAQSVIVDPDLFDSLNFNARGDLVVEFDGQESTPGSVGRVAVAIPRKEADRLLTPFGRQVRTAVSDTATRPLSETMDDNPAAVSVKNGSVDCAVARCVALAFQGGPGPYTERLLSALSARGARATFFMVGSHAAATPGVLRLMREQGDLVANQTWAHRDLTLLSTSMVYDQIRRAQHVIGMASGQSPSLLMAPYGATDGRVADVARGLGLSIVRGDVDAGDVDGADPKAVAERVVSAARRGSVIVMRDVGEVAAAALPRVLDELSGRGFVFVTVPELYGSARMTPGRVYSSPIVPSGVVSTDGSPSRQVP